jgi:hypothetical protein
MAQASPTPATSRPRASGPGLRLASGGLRTIGRGAAAAALLEVPVAVIEETLAVRRGWKTPEQAALAAGAKVGVAAVGGGIGAGLAYSLGVLGVGSLLAPVAPILLLAGSATVVMSTGLRLRAAFSAGAACQALTPEPAAEFIEMETEPGIQGGVIWFVPPATGSSGHPST